MITFKYIREIYENEKKHRNLQKLDDDFIKKINDYLQRKEKLIEKSSKTVMDYSVINEVENFRSLLRNLLELRKKKILLLALNHALSPPSTFDETIFLDFEKKLYEKIIDELKNFNDEVEHVFSTEAKDKEKVTEKENEKSQEKKEEKEMDKTLLHQTNKTEIMEEKKDSKYMVEATENIPSFLTYKKDFLGPYMKGERFICDKKIADMLKKLNKIKILYEIE